MGIKICPQCGGKVSDTRNDCPHCNYIFPKLKKCPDCEEEIDDSLSECPICGHTFEKETSKEVAPTIQAPQNNQEPQSDDALTCPYCNSTESMEIGNGLYLCATCKNKFLDTRGLPTPQPFIPKTENKPEENKTEESTNNTSTVANDRKDAGTIFLWSSVGFTIFSYLVNMIISLCIGGTLYYMFDYILYGFIAGFICMTLGIAGFVVSFVFLCKKKGDKALGTKIVSLSLMVSLLCVTFAPLVFYDPLTYEQNSDGTYSVVDCNDSATKVKIPPTHKGKPVTSIDFPAFDGCYNLTSVEIPDSVTAIGEYAFASCYSLTSVEIGDSVTAIGDYAFAACYSLTEIHIPDSVTAIGDYAFVSCERLTSVTIPDSVTSIGYAAFAYCSNLTIYCEAESKPSGWDDYWTDSYCPVFWGYKG